MPEAKAPKSASSATRSVAVKQVEPTAEDFALAHAALLDITTADTIGEPSGSLTEDDGSLTVYFDTTMAGYPGWKWTVSLARVKGFASTVLETELTPSEGALLSPDWVPWSERLADYKEAQALLAAEASAHDDDDNDDDDDDDDDFDDSDDDFDVDDDVHDVAEALLQSGDLNGVDIDSLDDGDGDDSGAEVATKAAPKKSAAKAAPKKSAAKAAPKKSAAPAVSKNEPKKTKSEADEASPNPARKPRSGQRAKKDEQGDKGE